MKKCKGILLLMTVFFSQSIFAQKYIVMSGTIKYIPVSQFDFTFKDKNLSQEQPEDGGLNDIEVSENSPLRCELKAKN